MEKRQYQREQDEIIRNLTGVPTILLHSCCGPCSSYCIEALAKHFDVTFFWYNPNIFPREEYDLRLENQKKIISEMKCEHTVSLLECDYDDERFYSAVKGLENEKEGGLRCTECFILRLEKCAKAAKEHGFDFFTTTLTVSPHKNAPLINSIGEDLAQKYGVKFLPSDFKKKNGYKRSIELSKEYGLYRQNYCGCVYSLESGNGNAPHNNV